MGEVPVELREVQEDDWPEMLQVLTAALGPGPDGRPRSSEWWRWKHVDNPFGPSIVIGAWADEKLVGVRAFVRWDLQWEGEIWPCVRAVDTATHPDWQGKGIFRRLTLAGLDAAQEQGIAQVFNTPNAKSGAGSLKMGWRSVGAIHAAIRPCGVTGVGRMAMAFLQPKVVAPSFAGGDLPSAAQALRGDRLDHLAAALNARSNDRLATHWTAERLFWRFAACPVADFRVLLNGDDVAAIIRLNQRRGLREGVVSLVHPQLRRLARMIQRVKPQPVDYWIWRPGSLPGSTLTALGKGFVRIPMSVMQLVHRPIAMNAGQEAVAADAAKWHLEFGDLELL